MVDDSSKQDHDQRGLVPNDTEPRFLVIGEVVKPHGVRGEMQVVVLTDEPERFLTLERVFVGEKNPSPMGVSGARFHKGRVLLMLEGVGDRTSAETMRGAVLQVPISEAISLEDDEYFLYQLEGLAVYTDAGEHLGEVVEVLETKANNVFVVNGGPRGEVLLPDIDDVVVEIDFDAKRMTVSLLPGLLP